jgi:hypothetical protein
MSEDDKSVAPSRAEIGERLNVLADERARKFASQIYADTNGPPPALRELYAMYLANQAALTTPNDASAEKPD